MDGCPTPGRARHVREAKPADDKAKKKPRKLIKEEERETGGVKWKIYNAYLKAS